MTCSSFEAQYVPSRYSSTYTGTLAPSLTSLVRSFRTTLPAKCRFSRSSRLVSMVLASEVIGECPVDYYGHALRLDAGFRIAQNEPVGGFLVVVTVLQDQRDPFPAFVH